MNILTELCQELKNWFIRGSKDVHKGTFTIAGNTIVLEGLLPNQYYRIKGSVFSDGVHQYGHEEAGEMPDETFSGEVWFMAVPPAVLQLAKEIEEWLAVYGGANGAAMSPYQSESFGGYSYSKGSGGTAGGTNGAAKNPSAWQVVFAYRLNKWRKLYEFSY